MKRRLLGDFSPFPLFGNQGSFSIHFLTPDGDGAAGGGAGGAAVADKGAGAAADAGAAGGDAEKPVPYADAQRLIVERDRTKAVNRAITEALGLQVEWVPDEATGKQKPVIKGLDELKTIREQVAAGEEDKRKKAGKWDEHKAELNRQHEQLVNGLKTSHEKTIKGRDTLIQNLAVEAPLRQALIDEGVIKESMDDVIKLIAPSFGATIETDEETGKPSLVVQPKGDDGKPLMDAQGNPVTPKQFVAAWLGKRPHLKAANFRRGPGAGGFGNGAAAAGGKNGDSAESRGDAAAEYIFGRK